jgi:shikimate kinase
MTATFLTSPSGSLVDPSRPHVILVGLPGAGKSTVGKGVADRLNRRFLDFDLEIERREGMVVSQIFAEKGEPYFREAERKLTSDLRDTRGMVLAPGGGWMIDASVVALLRPPSRIIYLKARPESCLKRLGPERTARPLLMRPDPLRELKGMLEQRRASYEGADFVVDTELLALEGVIRKVAELASSVV